MKVVFLEEVEGTARTGDVKNVADGFARNYLLPRKLAAPANDHYIAIAQAKAGKEARRQDRLDEEARAHVLPQVDGKSLRIEVRVGEQGKLFGSVTARDIAEALQAETRVELEHRQIDLKQPIRDLGTHEVAVKITRNVIANVTVQVDPIGGVVETEAPAEAASEEAPATEAMEETVAETQEAEAVAEEVGGPEIEDEAEEETAAQTEAAEEEPETETEQS
jgi:large subunit ribosomal protein L9